MTQHCGKLGVTPLDFHIDKEKVTIFDPLFYVHWLTTSLLVVSVNVCLTLVTYTRSRKNGIELFCKQPLVFTCLLNKSYENIVGQGEIARNEQFLLFLQCFLLFWRTFCHFHQNQTCRLQTLTVLKILKFVV